MNQVCGFCPATTGCLACTSKDVCTKCDRGYFLDQDLHACEACHENCADCLSDFCMECKQGMFRNLLTGQCSLDCASGEYGNKREGVCMVCPVGCTECESGSNCESCERGYSLTYLGECLPCADHCEHCEKGQCLKCATDFFEDATGICVSNCGAGMYGQKTSSKCMTCPIGCSRCESGKVCKDCIAGYSFNSETFECKGCDVKCADCADDVCNICHPGFYLDKDSQCVEDCGPKNFATTDANCETCPASCATCESLDLCHDCERGFQIDATSIMCEACTDSNCEHCKSNRCLKCKDTYFIDANGDCVDDCGAGFFASKRYGMCTKCPTGCTTCESGERCDGCIKGYQLNYLLQCEPCKDINCEDCLKDKCLTCKAEKWQDTTGLCVAVCPK